MTGYRGNGLADSPEEELLLIHIGLAVLVGVLGSAGLLWLRGAGWLVAHHILVPAAAHPLLAIPGAAGAGLDRARVTIVAAVVLAALVAAVSAAHHTISRRRQEEMV